MLNASVVSRRRRTKEQVSFRLRSDIMAAFRSWCAKNKVQQTAAMEAALADAVGFKIVVESR